MKPITADHVRLFILERFAERFQRDGIALASVPQSYDLMTAGIIDSLGVLDLVSAIEEHFGLTIDFENLDAENLTKLGPLCRFVEEAGKCHI